MSRYPTHQPWCHISHDGKCPEFQRDASPPPPAAAPAIRPSVVHRDGPYTPADYDEAIEALLQARAQTMDWALGNGQDGCRVCGDNGHTAEQCHHNPLVMAREASRRRTEYRCYHCGFLATTDEDAREHFGPDENADASCLTSQVRTLQGELEEMREQWTRMREAVENVGKYDFVMVDEEFGNHSRRIRHVRIEDVLEAIDGAALGKQEAPT